MSQTKSPWILSPWVGITLVAIFGVLLITRAAPAIARFEQRRGQSTAAPLRADNLYVGSAAKFGTPAGSDTLPIVDIKGSGNQLTLESNVTLWREITNGDSILDFDPVFAAGTTGTQAYRFFRHSTISDLGSGGDFEIQLSTGDSSTAAVALSAQNPSSFRNGITAATEFLIASGSASGGTGTNLAGPSVGQVAAGAATSVAVSVTFTNIDILAGRTYPTRARCFSSPVAGEPSPPVIVQQTAYAGGGAVNPQTITFSCFSMTTGIAAACGNLQWLCVYGE